ncbi:hypothetical protein RvY_06301 [Ramazzottius varieornatus]|uniref:Uncharacterized protein n=1 Tax=Ramazzottius varieornatus TaxID=947166 RepID=A0A1D1UY13_RAMVA|nr:hypothetical protein RvY_06301 [Ramazzottius varieornatus]
MGWTLDEEVSKWMLDQLIDPEVSKLKLSRGQRQQMDKMWLSMRVPSHENRKPRSLSQYKQFKAHKIRMFAVHALPVDYCDMYMRLFEEIFGVEQMKYSVHLISHLHLALRYYGPLSTVSCYGPENQIGRVTRNIQSMSNTTKPLMNNYAILNQSSIILATIAIETQDKINAQQVFSIRSLDIAVKALGWAGCYLPINTLPHRNHFYGKGSIVESSSADIAKTQSTEALRRAISERRAVSFSKAMVDTGIFVRPHHCDGNFLDTEQLPSCAQSRARDERRGLRWVLHDQHLPEPAPSVPKSTKADKVDEAALKKRAKNEKNVLASHLKNILTLRPKSHVVSKELMLKVCAVIGQVNVTPDATKNLSQQIGYAMPLAFPNDKETWHSRKTRTGKERPNSYRGVAFAELETT